MKQFTRVQLSIMMFLQFFVWGSWYVTAPNYLGTIGFTSADFGWTYSVGPIAGMISPFFVGMIADRFFPAQRVLGLLHLMGGGIMFAATTLMTAKEPAPWLINIVFFAYTLTFFPTLSLTNTIALRNMSDSEKEFPLIRVFGTIGWIAGGLILSQLKWDTRIDMFYLSASSAIVLGIVSFALPHTPPTSTGDVSVRQILGLDALVLLKSPAYLTFMVASVLICIPLAFYYQIASRVVEMASLPVGQTMSYGQMSEILFMVLMPAFFARLGVKWMLAVGMLAWVVRYALFSLGAPQEVAWMLISAIVLHGICYDFFFVTGQIYTDQVAPPEIRGQAQGLLVLFTLGLGMTIGAQVAAFVEGMHTPETSKRLARQVAAKAGALKVLDSTKPKTADKEKPPTIGAAIDKAFSDIAEKRTKLEKKPAPKTDSEKKSLAAEQAAMESQENELRRLILHAAENQTTAEALAELAKLADPKSNGKESDLLAELSAKAKVLKSLQSAEDKADALREAVEKSQGEIDKELERLKAESEILKEIASPKQTLKPDAKFVKTEEERLTEEKGADRKAELKAIEWQPLWAKPAAFAAVILVIFVVMFQQPPPAAQRTENSGNAG